MDIIATSLCLYSTPLYPTCPQ